LLVEKRQRGNARTMVASVIAGINGNGGVMGVLPGVSLVNYGVNASGGFTCGDAVAATAAMIRVKVPVLNMSVGTAAFCASLYRVVEQAIGTGMTVVAAAGNEFAEGNPVEYPAAFPHVLSVAALSPDGSSSYFSNENAAVDLSAPGEQVPVAIPAVFDVNDGVRDGVTLADGTSFSSPMVAAAAAWTRLARPSLSAGQVADVLRSGANDVGAEGWDASTGWGLLNIDNALVAATPREDPGEPNDDIPFVDGTYFRGADAAIYNGRRTASLRATVDYAEDPDDVFRIRVPGRSSAQISVTPSYGDPDLYVFSGSAKNIGNTRRVVVRSVRSRGTDRVAISNTRRRAVTAYIVVHEARDTGTIVAGYKLQVKRLRFTALSLGCCPQPQK
jgi:Subtilase family